jgi:hypothetical protein
MEAPRVPHLQGFRGDAVSEGRHDTYAHASCPRDSDLASYRVRRRGRGSRGWCTRGRVGQRRGEDASADVVVVVHFGGGFARGEDAGRGRRTARCARQPCSVSVAPRHGFGRPKPMLSAGTVHALSPLRGRRASGRAAGGGFGARPHRGVRSGAPRSRVRPRRRPTIFAQPDAEHVHSQLDVIAGMLGPPIPARGDDAAGRRRRLAGLHRLARLGGTAIAPTTAGPRSRTGNRTHQRNPFPCGVAGPRVSALQRGRGCARPYRRRM